MLSIMSYYILKVWILFIRHALPIICWVFYFNRPAFESHWYVKFYFCLSAEHLISIDLSSVLLLVIRWAWSCRVYWSIAQRSKKMNRVHLTCIRLKFCQLWLVGCAGCIVFGRFWYVGNIADTVRVLHKLTMNISMQWGWISTALSYRLQALFFTTHTVCCKLTRLSF